MTYPDQENTLVLLKEWQHHHGAITAMFDGINAHMGFDPNGLMFVTVWAVFEAYTNTLAVEIGDYCGWLDWFRFEAEMGARDMTAGYDGQTRCIKTREDLFGLIAESRRRKPS